LGLTDTAVTLLVRKENCDPPSLAPSPAGAATRALFDRDRDHRDVFRVQVSKFPAFKGLRLRPRLDGRLMATHGIPCQ
jgi:hypothetical protein